MLYRINVITVLQLMELLKKIFGYNSDSFLIDIQYFICDVLLDIL